jgi:iron complex outermembrane receptor protein
MNPITLLLLATSLLLSGIQSLRAQSTISGILQDEAGLPVPLASVHLLESKDSSLVKGALTNDLGKYDFINIKTGKYIISSTHTGMSEVFSEVISVTEVSRPIDAGILMLTKKTDW